MPSYAYNDPDAAGRLLTPAKRKRHQVRIQGRLVLVRSVSAVNLASPLSSTSAVPPLPSTLRDDPGVGNYTVSSAGQQKKRHNTRWTMKPTATAARRQSYAGPEAGPEMGPPSTEDGFFLGGDDNGEDNDHDGAVNASASDTEEDEHETALRDRQRRGYGIGGAGNIRRPTEVVQFYSSSLSRSGGDTGPRRRWKWMNSLLVNLRGKKEGNEKGNTKKTSIS